MSLRSRDLVERASGDDQSLPSLSIVVPARNEERNIELCVNSLLAQKYSNFEVIVVDDRSTDATRELLRSLESDARLRIVDGAELPEGWVGKPWALTQGANVATGEWLLFTDADTDHEDAAAASSVRTACDRGYDAMSLLTDQVMVSLGERIALPTILWTIALGIGALADVNDPRKPDAAIFNGQYVLIRRDVYDAIGGHRAVMGEIVEDLELAKLLKRKHYRTALLGADGLVRTRMYRSFVEVWNGFVKNFALGVRGRPVFTALALAYFALLSPLTPAFVVWALATHRWAELSIVLGGMTLSLATAGLGMRRFGLPAGSERWLPVGQFVLLGIFATSLVKHATGRVSWRGRQY